MFVSPEGQSSQDVLFGDMAIVEENPMQHIFQLRQNEEQENNSDYETDQELWEDEETVEALDFLIESEIQETRTRSTLTEDLNSLEI